MLSFCLALVDCASWDGRMCLSFRGDGRLAAKVGWLGVRVGGCFGAAVH